MSNILFDLQHSSSLRRMVPPQVGGGFGPASLPGNLVGPGIYVVVNTHTNNRYVGISTQLQSRFWDRLVVVTELAFSAAQLGQIYVCWGNVVVQNTVTIANPAPVPQPFAPIGSPFDVVVDNVSINAEHLLIRMCRQVLGAGGTVSNNQHVAQFHNNTPHPMTVTFAWGAIGNVYAAGAQQTLIAAGGQL